MSGLLYAFRRWFKPQRYKLKFDPSASALPFVPSAANVHFRNPDLRRRAVDIKSVFRSFPKHQQVFDKILMFRKSLFSPKGLKRSEDRRAVIDLTTKVTILLLHSLKHMLPPPQKNKALRAARAFWNQVPFKYRRRDLIKELKH